MNFRELTSLLMQSLDGSFDLAWQEIGNRNC